MKIKCRKIFKKALALCFVFVMISNCFGAALTTSAATVPTQYTEFKVDDTYLLTIGRGGETFVKFTPKFSGKYVLESTCITDSKAALYDSNMNQLATDDNGKNADKNFSLSYDLMGNTTYYYGVSFVNPKSAGQCMVTLTCRQTFCDHKNQVYDAGINATCHSDGYTSGTYCSDCEFWFTGHEKLPGGHIDTKEDTDESCDRCGGEMPYKTGNCGPSDQPHLVKYDRYADQSVVIYGSSYINYAAFQDDDMLTKVTVLPGVTYVGDNAFYDCDELREVTLPKSIFDIRHDSFFGCDKLTSINIPEGVKWIGYCAFSYCHSLKSIKFPDTLLQLGMEAFKNCDALEEITFGTGLTEISSDTFRSCTSLKTVIMNNSIENLRSGAFADCTKLSFVVLSSSLRAIGAESFKNTAITQISIPSRVETLGNSAFENCTSLFKISIPKTVTNIGNKTFMGCNELQTIYYRGSETDKNSINIGTDNYPLSRATWYYNCCTDSPTHQYDNGCDEDCNSCGDRREAPGHVEEVVKGYAPTCTGAGLTDGKKCKICGKTLVNQLFIKPEGHKNGYLDYVPPTCNKTGLTTGAGCPVCGEVFTPQQVIPKTDHREIDLPAKAPTCSVEGHTAGKKCSECGAFTLNPKTIPAKGHTKVALKAVSATCEKAGKTAGEKCSVCNVITKPQTTIKALGHSYKSTTTKATTSKDGKIVEKCTRCNEVKKTTTIYKIKSVKLSYDEYTYNGKSKKPSVIVKDSKGKTVSSSYYTVSYASGRKSIGKYKVTVTFKGNYSGSKTLYFKINPKKVSSLKLKSSKKKELSVSWKKDSKASGYEIVYATNSKFTKSKKTVKITSYKTYKKTIKSLKSKGTYYVKVRAYKTVKGTKYYGSYCSYKKLKIK